MMVHLLLDIQEKYRYSPLCYFIMCDNLAIRHEANFQIIDIRGSVPFK